MQIIVLDTNKTRQRWKESLPLFHQRLLWQPSTEPRAPQSLSPMLPRENRLFTGKAKTKKRSKGGG